MEKESSPADPRVEIGREGESRVRAFFEAKGWRLVTRNFRWRRGELDLIFEDPSRILVFVEVRSSSEPSAFLRFSIGFKKRAALLRSTHYFRRGHPLFKYHAIRLDVCWVEAGSIQHWPNVWLS